MASHAQTKVKGHYMTNILGYEVLLSVQLSISINIQSPCTPEKGNVGCNFLCQARLTNSPYTHSVSFGVSFSQSVLSTLALNSKYSNYVYEDTT
jgi:hypothetical protein